MLDLKHILYQNLRESALPVFDFGDHVIPAASIWTGSRQWINTFRDYDISHNDRIVIQLENDVALLPVLVAALWEKITLVVASPDENVKELVSYFDAAFSVSHSRDKHNIDPDKHGMPSIDPSFDRRFTSRFTPDLQFILKTSGTLSEGRWVCLKRSGIEHVLSSHLSMLEYSDEETIVSVLPWHHCFGLILDLLPAILNKNIVVRKCDGGRNLAELHHTLSKESAIRFNCVPWHIIMLKEEQDQSFLSNIKNGLIGGAKITKQLAGILKGSNMRVGYGQTEASPGIMLGEKGIFREGIIGKPVGCSVKISENDELMFRGKNSFAGYWGSLKDAPESGEWINTNDIVEFGDDGHYTFLARSNDDHKLPNGTELNLSLAENSIRTSVHGSDVCLTVNENGDLRLHIKTDKLSNPSNTSKKIHSLPRFSKWITDVNYVPRDKWPMNHKGETNRSVLQNDY